MSNRGAHARWTVPEAISSRRAVQAVFPLHFHRPIKIDSLPLYFIRAVFVCSAAPCTLRDSHLNRLFETIISTFVSRSEINYPRGLVSFLS